MSKPLMIYSGDCRVCNKQMRLTIKAKEGTVEDKQKKRVRCSNCENVTELPQSGAV